MGVRLGCNRLNLPIPAVASKLQLFEIILSGARSNSDKKRGPKLEEGAWEGCVVASTRWRE